jgi:hypothetical protein
MAKRNQKHKKNNKHDNTQLSATTLPLWVCNLGLFLCLLFFGFFFRFLVFWFLVGFFEGLAKQHKSEGPRPDSLPVLPL